MNLVANTLNSKPIPIDGQDDGIIEVGETTSLLGVDSYQVQLLPYLLQQEVQVQPHMATNHHMVLTMSDLINLLQTDRIDLVEHVQALHILSVTWVGR